jgi:oligoendopeptidase F
MINQCIQGLNLVHPDFGQVIDKMREMGHLDLESRKGKRPGGYNMPLHVTGIPFIFMNAANSINDLRTLMHESGHAVHAFLTKDLQIAATRHFPSEISELAAMTMELFTMEHWDQIFNTEEELKRAQLFQMEMVIKVLPWIATIDKFQHWLYTNPHHSRAERRAQWLHILQEFTPEVLDNSGLENYLSNLWLKQLHIFEVPFYYIEYGFAQLGAIALWKKYHESPEKATQSYIKALKLGYTKSVTDIYEAADIKFDFSNDYVAQLGAFILTKIKTLV